MIMVNNWLARLLPPRCLLCGMDGGRNGLCRACLRDLPVIEHPCPLCALPLPTADALACGRCLTDPPPWRRCVSALLYEAPASHLIAALKYRARLPVARLLGETLAAQIGPAPQIDAILPVPLHWRRRWQRGFNQAEIIADELGRRLQLPVHTRWLVRHRATPAQQSLSAAERARNLRGAFALRHRVVGLRIAVVDDVVTTGHTATEATCQLLAAGAAAVEIWSLARTPA
jgi:ComF family protein